MRLYFKSMNDALMVEENDGAPPYTYTSDNNERIGTILRDVNEKRESEGLEPLINFIDATEQNEHGVPKEGSASVILVDLGVSYSPLTGISKGNVGTILIDFCRPNRTPGLEHENEFATSFCLDITQVSSVDHLLTGWGPCDDEVNKTIAKDLHCLIKEAEDAIR